LKKKRKPPQAFAQDINTIQQKVSEGAILKKALIISVGTGVKPSSEAIESLANAIAFSIENNNPDHTFFITSEESTKNTIPKILEKIRPKNYEIVKIADPDDIQLTYEALSQKLKEIRQNFDYITIDYTSGTKAMTSAMTILGTIIEADTLSYISGIRKGGIVQQGTEKLNTVRPLFAITEEKIKVAIQFFNKHQFDSTLSILNQIEKTTRNQDLINQLTPLKNAAQAYQLWDKFQHQEAFQKLSQIKKETLNQNKRFLGQLTRREEREPYYVADLINNAKRRGTDEKKHDDAVARLYRTIELLAQYQLKGKYNIDPSAAKPEDIPKRLHKKWKINHETKKIQIPLEKAYELLKTKNDELGKKFAQDNELKNLLTKRNNSILAHGLTPVNEETYLWLYEKVIQYASLIIEKLTPLLGDSTFTEWN
jgi:CRISPR-associated protein (TIGR02710 family)